MPRPPRADIVPQIKFITNYFWQGCEAPWELVVEFSQEPLKELFLILFWPDAEDLLKEWLRPGRGRQRNPARHGKKRRRFPGLPDPNDWVSANPRARAQAYPGIDLPGARALFKLTDVADRINITAAVVEGLSDVGFETLWGILSLHTENCPAIAYVNAHNPEGSTIVGVAPWSTPFPLPVIDNRQRFGGPEPFTFTTTVDDFNVVASGTVFALSSGGLKNWALTVGQSGKGIVARSNFVNIEQGESAQVSVYGTVEKGQAAYIARQNESGSAILYDLQMFAWSGQWW